MKTLWSVGTAKATNSCAIPCLIKTCSATENLNIPLMAKADSPTKHAYPSQLSGTGFDCEANIPKLEEAGNHPRHRQFSVWIEL